MERIGTLLRRLKLDPASLAARGHDGAHKLEDGPASPGGAAADPSMLSRGEEAQASKLEEKAEAEAPASGAVMEVNSRNRQEGGHQAKLKLVSRGMRSVNRQQGRPTPALRRPVLIVIKGHHASTPWG